jgi:hypothetical protein
MSEPKIQFLSDVVRETKEATAIKMYIAAAEKIKYGSNWQTASEDLKNAYREAARHSYIEAWDKAFEGVEENE